MGESAYNADALSPYDTLVWSYINKLDQGCTLTFIEQKRIVTDCKLFPNPTNNFISFSGFTTNGMTHYSIVNLYGQIMMEDDTHNHSIDVTELASGQYILTIQNEEQQAVKQFVKN